MRIPCTSSSREPVAATHDPLIWPVSPHGEGYPALCPENAPLFAVSVACCGDYFLNRIESFDYECNVRIDSE